MSSPDKVFQPGDPKLTQAPPLSYGRLRQRHPSYDGQQMQELHDLYEGGYAIKKKAGTYLPRLVNENKKRYDERCATAAYLGYMGQVVDEFTSDLFAQPLSMLPAADAEDPNTPGELPDEDFYTEFESDTDMAGNAFVDLLKVCMTTALVQRCAYVLLDAPTGNEADGELTSGVKAPEPGRLYAYEVSPRQVIDWKENKRGGGLQWAIINRVEQERETPLDARDRVHETFTVWTMKGGIAHWDRYGITYDPTKPPEEDDLVPLEDSGDTDFKRLPLLRMQLPKGLWIGNAIGCAQLEHWRRRSTLIGAQNRSMVAIPFVKRGPEVGRAGGAQPSDTQENPTRGRDPVGTFERTGAVEIGSDDELGYAEPKGTAYALVNKELDELKDEIFRVSHKMAASVRPSAGALGRSAASKQQDGKATSLVLRALGHESRKFATRIYDTVAEARVEDVVWAPNGLDNYEIIDRESVLEEAISLDQVNIPSKTFHTIYAQQVAAKLLTGVDPRTIATINEEIAEGVEAKREVEDLKVEATKDMLENPPPPVPPTPKAPVVQTPQAKGPVPPQPGGGKKAA